MKHYLPLLILLLTSSQAISQDTIYSIAYTQTAWRYFYFEDTSDANYFLIDSSQLNNIWQIGKPVKPVFDSAYSQPNALVTDTTSPYPINNVSSFSFTVFSDDATTIEFWHRLDTDEGNDGGVIEVSYDSGDSWVDIANSGLGVDNFYSLSDTISAAHKPGFSGSSAWQQSTIYGSTFTYIIFRFTFYSDSLSDNKDGWMIDDILVNCMGTGIENVIDENLIIYPNPSSDFVFIKSKNDFANNIVIKNLLGQIVKTVLTNKVDVSELSNGVYIVESETPKEKIVSRLIKN
jgi:hypothetical protein